MMNMMLVEALCDAAYPFHLDTAAPSWPEKRNPCGSSCTSCTSLYKHYKLYKLVCICFLLLFSIFSSIYWWLRWRWRREWKMLLCGSVDPSASHSSDDWTSWWEPLSWPGAVLSPSPLVLFGNIQTQQCHHLWTRSSPPFSTLRAGEARLGPPRGTIRAFGRIWRWWPGAVGGRPTRPALTMHLGFVT